ncbi:MAG: hypothetical protein ACREOG_21340 [Gemmatimonadaceae bacterium]
MRADGCQQLGLLEVGNSHVDFRVPCPQAGDKIRHHWRVDPHFGSVREMKDRIALLVGFPRRCYRIRGVLQRASRLREKGFSGTR